MKIKIILFLLTTWGNVYCMTVVKCIKQECNYLVMQRHENRIFWYKSLAELLLAHIYTKHCNLQAEFEEQVNKIYYQEGQQYKLKCSCKKIFDAQNMSKLTNAYKMHILTTTRHNNAGCENMEFYVRENAIVITNLNDILKHVDNVETNI